MKKLHETLAFLAFFIVCAFIVLAIIWSGIAHAENADRFAISGGTNTQNQAAFDALETSGWDWDYGWQQYPSTPMKFVASFPPYWYEDGNESLAVSDDETLAGQGIYILRDDMGAAIGLARYPIGDTYIKKYYPGSSPMSGPYLNEVVLHEAAHARLWFVWLKGYPEVWQEWTRLCTLGIPPSAVGISWDSMPAENQAEHHRWAYANTPQVNDHPRTRLNTFDKQTVWDWHDALIEGQKPPTPPPPAGSQSITVNPGPYRSVFTVQNPDDGYKYATVTGTYKGEGSVWFVPDPLWGPWANATQATTHDDGTYECRVVVPWSGPSLIPFQMVLFWDKDHQAVYEGEDTFDNTTPPYWDIDASTTNDDWELYDATWYGRSHSLTFGYPNGAFRPYEGLSRRHIWLIAERSKQMGYPIGDAPSMWQYSYSQTATRGDVRNAFPKFEFDSNGWGEQITRGQIMRLILRYAER